MRTPSTVRIGSLVAVVTVGLGGLAGPAAASDRPASLPVAARGATVTLLSGDRVAVVDGTVRDVTPGAGREDVRFVRRVEGDDAYVIPSDALGGVSRGLLDEQLFNVTRLAEGGADSAVPIIVRYAAGERGERARTAVKAAGATEGRPVRALSARAMTVDGTDRSRVWQRLITGDGVSKVWLNARLKLLLDRSVPQIGAPAAWQAGFTGKGVRVAVLDSGLDPEHPDLRGRVVAAKGFVEAEPGTGDADGHGTHVASTVAGSGAASGGKFKGVAPDADLLIGRVCGTDDCTTDDVLAGMQWAVDSGARIVNMSLGHTDAPGVDPLEEAVNTLTAASGALFVVSAGNDGADRTVGSPASADAALAVAAVDDRDELARFSSRGPRIDGVVKPDLAAPGVGIVAARAKGTLADDAVDEHHAALDGTSMASPHVAGTAALLAQAHPDWKAEQLKGALVGAAAPLTAPVTAVGSGRVDVARAVTTTAYASPVSASFGLAKWPHPKDEQQSRTVTLHNTGGAAQTFELTVSGKDPAGAPAPAVFTVAQPRVVVPANGSASVTVTAHTGLDGPYGLYTGVLTATAGDTQVRIAMGVDREPESYDLDIRATDRTGAATDAYVQLYPVPTTDGGHAAVLANGRGTARLPAGRWTAVAITAEKDDSFTMEAVPDLRLRKDTTLTFDSRKGKAIHVTVPEKTARVARSYAGVVLGSDTYSVVYAMDGADGVTMKRTSGMYAVPTRSRAASGFTFFAESQWAKPKGDGYLDSPYTYQVLLPAYGGIPAKHTHALRRAELAKVTATFAGTGTVQSNAQPYFAHRSGGGFWNVVTNRVPGSRTTYYTTGNGTVAWAREMIFDNSEQNAPPRTFKAGSTYTEHWNRPVFGPSLPKLSTEEYRGVRRIRDVMTASLPLFSDSTPGHYGTANDATGKATLSSGTTLIAESTDPYGIRAEVPAGRATYRLAAEATSGARSVTADWTFRSAHVKGRRWQALPLSTVQFRPRRDARGTIDLTVQSQISGNGSGVRKLVVEASTDGGRTWRAAPVRRGPGGTWTATVRPGAAAGTWVALRSALTRTDGGTANQTLKRAYQL